MSFKKLLILSFVASLSIFNLHAENHDAEQNIIDKFCSIRLVNY